MTHETHAYPWGTRYHRPDRTCPCGPLAMGDLSDADAVVWRHRLMPLPPEPLRGEKGWRAPHREIGHGRD